MGFKGNHTGGKIMRLKHFGAKVAGSIESINESMGFVTGALLLLLTIGVTVEVFNRFVLRSPQAIMLGLNTFFFGTAIMLGGGYTLYHRSHVRMDILYNSLSQRKKSIIDSFLTSIAIFCVVGGLIWKGTMSWWQAWMMNFRVEGIEVLPLWPFLLVIPIGSLLLGAQGFLDFLRAVNHVVKKYNE